LTSIEGLSPEIKERLRRTVEWKRGITEEEFTHHTPWFSPRSLGAKEKSVKSVLRCQGSEKEKLYFKRLNEKKVARFEKMRQGASMTFIDQYLCKPHRRYFYISSDGAELCWEKHWERKLHSRIGFKFPLKKKKRPLATVVRIVYGPFRKWMVAKNPTLSSYIPWLCFTLELAVELEDIPVPELLGFVCSNEEQLDTWLTGLSEHCPVSRYTYFPYPRILWRRMKIKIAHGPAQSAPFPLIKKKGEKKRRSGSKKREGSS